MITVMTKHFKAKLNSLKKDVTKRMKDKVVLGYDNSGNASDKARLHHYGGDSMLNISNPYMIKGQRIPARPFIDLFVVDYNEGFKNAKRGVIRAVVIADRKASDAMKLQHFLTALGKIIVNYTKKVVKTLEAKDARLIVRNARKTIRKKGFDNPLIETKEMINNFKMVKDFK